MLVKLADNLWVNPHKVLSVWYYTTGPTIRKEKETVLEVKMDGGQGSSWIVRDKSIAEVVDIINKGMSSAQGDVS